MDKGVLSNADKGNKSSKDIAFGIARRIGLDTPGAKLKGQVAGNEFEIATAQFVRQTFLHLNHLRPGIWTVNKIGEKPASAERALRKKEIQEDLGKLIAIARFEQYRHLIAIAKAASENPELAASLGNDYIIKPDIVIFRELVSDEEINSIEPLVDDAVALNSTLRRRKGAKPILHASISCKLTIRSDRSQNSRSEALNLIRNRRGKLPHIVVVTAEPMPSRLSSIALGGGDIDCVYHFALPELMETVKELGLFESEERLKIMVNGNRLKDISDLPLDLGLMTPPTSKQRSENMRRIRSKDTIPEMVVRRIVYSMGARYRLHVAHLPGKPDLVFAGRKKIVDVRGCFWHQHKGCIDSHIPKSRVDYWLPKLQGNCQRDRKNLQALRARQFRVLTIWECETKRTLYLQNKLKKFLEL